VPILSGLPLLDHLTCFLTFASSIVTAVAALNSVRIRLRYPDLDTFVEKFAPNVTRGGIFLASRNVQPVGATISFEIQLVNGEVALAGQGKVTWTKEFNAAEPSKPYGMGVQFTSVDPATRPTLARVLRARETGGIVPRRTTGALTPLGDAALRSTPGLGLTNGRYVATVDTTVDLVAEFGLDDATVRRVIDRTWVSLSGARAVEDLADLLKEEPAETVTLAQALAELPRLLDPSLSRRRASGGFRATDAAVSGAQPQADSGAVSSTAAVDPAEITQQTDAAAAVAAHGSQDAEETTDMTGGTLPDDGSGTSEVAVEAGAGGHGHSDRRRGRRRRR
jgi:uncharacterized protein (TIGR02266 family)